MVSSGPQRGVNQDDHKTSRPLGHHSFQRGEKEEVFDEEQKQPESGRDTLTLIFSPQRALEKRSLSKEESVVQARAAGLKMEALRLHSAGPRRPDSAALWVANFLGKM